MSRALGSAAFKAWNPEQDLSLEIKNGMDIIQTWVRPYYESVRYAESHDSASGQNDGQNKRIAARPPWRQGLQMAKTVGAVVILCNGIPMIFMGQETGEIRPFSMENLPDHSRAILNPQGHIDDGSDNSRVLAWYQSLLGLRNNADNGLLGDDSQAVRWGRKSVAFTRGFDARFFVVCTFATPDQWQSSAALGLPGGIGYKEVFNSSWPAYAVEFEAERTNGGFSARIQSGQYLNLPYIGAIVLERC
jgi:1,4-alpha-glucan branching enzyme